MNLGLVARDNLKKIFTNVLMSDYAQKFVTQVAQGAPLQTALQDALQQETEIRRLFATDRSNKVLNEPMAGLIDVFAASEKIRVTQARDIGNDQAKLETEYVFPLKKDRRANGLPSMVTDIDHFRNSWSIFTENALGQLTDWSNVVAAGGSVLASLLPLPEHAKGSKRAIRKYFHEQTYSTSDIDLFLYGLTPEQAEKKAIQIYEAVRDSVPWDTICVRTKHAISIHSQYPYRPVQIILRLYKSPAEILAGFDIDCACFLYNGDSVWANPRAIAAVMTQANLVDMTRRSPSYEVRLAKYALRGFEVHVPNLVREDVDPTIFERSINRIEGLARLLVLEKLSDPQDRTKYLEKRRELRGRPQPQGYSRRAMRRRRKLVRGDLKASDEQFGGLSLSDYGTASFHIPYGPGFDAKKIEKFIYGTDLGMNSTFNPKNENRRLHRHFAFFGTMDEVINDCCEYCPDPLTQEEKDLQAEEDKTYVRGHVEFMQEDPGRQMMTGSFHPIDEGEWATQAYLGPVEKLFQAVTSDDLETVVDIVESGFDLKKRDHVGRTPLHVAILSRSDKVTNYLIDAGARITSRLVDGRTALHLAAQVGSAEVVTKLLERSKQNEIKAEQEKAEAEAKKKAEEEAKKNEDAESSHSIDEDEEMRASSEDDWDSDTDAPKKKKDKDQPAETVNDPPAEGAAIPEDNEELPDILEINAVDWDQNLSPLCHAVVAGHLAVVETLTRAGADVQTPFKRGTYNAITLYPLTLTLLTENENAACAIAERLMEAGGSSTAADETLKTIFHRAVLAGSLPLVRTFLRVDPNAKTAMGFLTQATWGNAYTPMVSAIGLNNRAMTALLIAWGSSVKITEEMFDKSWDARQNLGDRSYYRPPKNPGQWLKDSCMPVETSLAQKSDLVLPLVQLGADLNFALRDEYRNVYGSDKVPIQATILDKLRECIVNAKKNYKIYERMTGGVVKEPIKPEISPVVPPILPEDTFLGWFNSQCKKVPSLMRHAAGQALPPMQPFKPKEDTSLPWTALEQVARAQIEWLQEVTKAVVAHGGKTAREINAINFPDLKVEPNITPGTVPTPAQYFTPFTGFLASTPAEPKLVKYRIIRTGYNQTEDVAAHLVEGYASLFEACWRGDIHTIERLCLPPKSGKKSKDATYLQIAAEIVPSKIGLFISRSDLSFTTLSIAILAKQWDAAKAILAIAEAQHEKPKDMKKSFQVFSPKDDSDEEHDSEMSAEEDSDVDEPKPVLIDLASRMSTVKTPISPAQLWSLSLFYDEKGAKTKDAVLKAVAEADLPALERSLELGQMCEPKVTMSPMSLQTILENDSPSMLEFVIRKYGYGLPSMEEDDHEPQDEEGGGPKKKTSDIYLGLNVQGKKRKDLARAADPNAPTVYAARTLPLIWRAAQAEAHKALTWLTTPGPLQAYKAFMSQSKDEAAIAMKRISKFEERLPSLLGAQPNELGEHVLLAYLTTTTEPKVETINLIFNLFPHLKKTFIHKKVKGLGMTALLYVAGANLKPEIFDLFLARGSDVLATDFRGCNILHALAWRGHLNLMKHVFTKLTQDQLATLLSQETKGRGNTPFMLAVKARRIHVVDFLLAFDHPVTAASLITRDGQGSLPIHYSTSTGCLAIVKSLLGHTSGVKALFVENGVGTTPLEMAEFRHQLQNLDNGYKNQERTPDSWSPSWPSVDDKIKYEENEKSTNYALLKGALEQYPETNKVEMEEVKVLEETVLSLDQEGRFIGQPQIKQVLETYVERTKAAAIKWEQLSTVRSEFKEKDKELSPPPPPPIVSLQDPGSILDTQDVKGTYEFLRDAVRTSGTKKRRELVHLLDAQRAVDSALTAATKKTSYNRHQFNMAGTFNYRTNTYTTEEEDKKDAAKDQDDEKSGQYRYMLNFSSANIQFSQD